ncbi:MAG: hypothetical protein IIX56_05510, partial [Treponema sp.]|nr:hypothetical protein [Treponema sp.]
MSFYALILHDEERGNIFVQLNSGTILSKLNSGSSRGNVSSSVQENFTARLIVTNGLSEIYSTSKAVSENDNLTFSVAGLPVKTFVTVKMQIIGSSGTVYFEGSKDVYVLEGNIPVEIVLKSTSSGQEFVLNTKFKLCGTLYNGDKLQHFYNYTDISTLPLNDNEIKFFFVPYETDLTNFDPNNFSYVPADKWSWELNGNKLDGVVDSVNPCSVSLATPGLEYEKTNVLTCTVKIGEVWYQAVHKFTVEQPAASANYNSYAFYVENKDYYNGYISAYNVDSRFVIPGTENEISGYKFNVTADAGKTYLYYKESGGSDSYYKIMCSQNKPGMEESAASNLNLGADTLEGTTVNWLTDSGNTTGQGKLIGQRIAYDSVTKKYWMLGMASSNYYMLSTASITETAELQHYDMSGLIGEGKIESLDGNVDFAVYNNYIVLYVKPYDTYSTKLHILKINEGNGLEYITYIDNVSICPLNIELTDIQAVGSDIYLLYGTSISYYYGDGHHSYGFVARLTYKGDDAAVPYEYDNSFGTVGLTANFSKETVIKMSDGYYSDSGSYNEATYFSYYGPTEEDADCSFFSPQYFAAIKDDYLYVIDDGFRKKEDSETGALANRDRLMKVSLKDKTVSVEKDGISLMAGNGSVP